MWWFAKISDDKWIKEINIIYKNYDTFSLPGFNDQVVMDAHTNKLEPRCKILLSNLKNFIKINKNDLCLDYGCGRGAMLNAISNVCDNLFGFDHDDTHEGYLSKIKNFKSLYTSRSAIPKQNFNLITMVHSFEHFVNPFDDLIFASELLKDEGFLFIQVNDTRLNPFEVLVADHLTHFEPGTLSKMIEKAGFKVVSVDNNWVTKEISMLAKKTTLRR